MTSNDLTAGLKAFIKSHRNGKWPKGVAMPTEVALKLGALHVPRCGTAKWVAVSMFFMPGGSTQPDVEAATGDTQNNGFNSAITVHGARDVSTGTRPHPVHGRPQKLFALAAAKPVAKPKPKPVAKPVEAPVAPASEPVTG